MSEKKPAATNRLARLGWFLAGLALFFIGMRCSTGGLQDLMKLRQLQRLTPVEAVGVLPGEAILSGKVKSADRPPLISPKQKVASVYYRYRVEYRCRDSDGDETWCVSEDKKQYIPFLIQDNTGTVLVEPGSRVEWDVPKQFEEVDGNKRYTEWRLHPGDTVNAIGYIDNRSMKFSVEGHYLPIISTNSVAEIRGDVGHGGLIWLWLGVTCGIGSVFCILYSLQVHRVMVHVLIQTLGIALFLGTDGINMIRADLLAAHQWFEQRKVLAENEISRLYRKHHDSWQGWQQLKEGGQTVNHELPEPDIARVRSIYQSLIKNQLSLEEQSQRFFARVALLGHPVNTEPLPYFDWVNTDPPETLMNSRLSGWLPWAELVVSGLLGAVLLIVALKSIHWKRMIENLPTSKIKGVMPGLAELQGKVCLPEDQQPLASPLKGIACVYYQYVVREKRRQNNKTKWVTIVDETQSREFELQDDSAQIAVDPAKAKVISYRKYRKTEGKREYCETILGLDDDLYVLGECQWDQAATHELKIAKGDDSTPFIVSNLPERMVLLLQAGQGIGLLTASFSLFILFMLILFGMAGGFAFSDLVLAGLTAPVFGLLVMTIIHYNDLVFLRQRVSRNWANIDVMLQKRFDLFRSLQEVVQKMMAHEKELLEMLSQVRTQATPRAGDARALQQSISQQEQVASRWVALQEAYPDIKANEVASRFMHAMSNMETELSLVRSAYNDAVEYYNARLQSFPDVLLAKAFGFDSKEFGRW